MTDYTTNFNLEKYKTGDAANLNDQYNASMDIIDDNLYKINTNANTAGGKATQALETAQNNNKNLAALGVTDTKTATALKNKIDNTNTTANNALNLAQTNKTAVTAINADLNTINTDLNAINANLTALHANSVSNATNLYNTVQKIDGIYSNIELKRKTYTNIAIIGDSISYGTGASTLANAWANQFKSYIGADTVQNMSQNNAGYVNEPTFLSQLQAVNNKTKITHIIIAGGANDKLQTTTNITNAVKKTLQYALTNFPNAEIHVAPVVLGVNGMFRYHANIPQTLNAIEEGIAQTPNVHEIQYAWEWLNGREDWASTSDTSMDAIHPNDNGQKQLLRLFAESLFTRNGIHNDWKTSVSGTDNHGQIVNSESVCNNGIYTFNCQFKVVNNHTAYAGIIATCYGLSTVNNYNVTSNYHTGNLYASTNSAHRGIIACTTAIPNNTEIYCATTHSISA
ncbi:MAG: GDSL-like Lipase/Acylhydrolase family protein [Bacteriophage sp.]|nr:MAG: GDSL-like Lipase/Acylhydrolase family protein [Bacteriophage sp.]